MVEEFQLAPDIGAADLAADELLVACDRADDLVGALVDELDAEAAGAELEQAGDVVGAGLGPVVVNGVATAGIGFEREFGADAVAQRDDVGVARAAAVAIVFAGREKRAEDAVLHVKHGHVLVNREVEPRAGCGLEERLELGDVEIVAGGDALEAVALEVVRGGEGIGDVEGEVTSFAVGGEVGEMVVVADQVAVGVAGADLFENPFFAGLGDAGRGDPDRRIFDSRLAIFDWAGALPSAEFLDGVAVVLGVFELAIDGGDAGAGEGGVELGEAADDDDELRSRGLRRG